MPKIKEVEKETCPQGRKKRDKLAITSREEVVSRLIGKWKGGKIVFEFLKNNQDRKKRESKRKKDEIS